MQPLQGLPHGMGCLARLRRPHAFSPNNRRCCGPGKGQRIRNDGETITFIGGAHVKGVICDTKTRADVAYS